MAKASVARAYDEFDHEHPLAEVLEDINISLENILWTLERHPAIAKGIDDYYEQYQRELAEKVRLIREGKGS